MREPARVRPDDTLELCPLQSCPIRYTNIHHPLCATTPIFALPKVEHDPATGRFGVHHGAALWGAQIIACNTVGYLSTNHRGVRDLELPIDSILLADTYFFFPDDGSNDYGICESFLSWGFPHGSIPAEWVSIAEEACPAAATGSHSGYPARVRARDASCRVSGFMDELANDIAHLVPKAPAEEIWVGTINSSVNIDILISITTVRVQLHVDVQSVQQPRNKPRHSR